MLLLLLILFKFSRHEISVLIGSLFPRQPIRCAFTADSVSCSIGGKFKFYKYQTKFSIWKIARLRLAAIAIYMQYIQWIIFFAFILVQVKCTHQGSKKQNFFSKTSSAKLLQWNFFSETSSVKLLQRNFFSETSSTKLLQLNLTC